MLRVWVQVELKLAHGVPTVGEKGDLLIELMALRLQHVEQASLRFLVKGLDEGKAFTGDGRFGLLTLRERQEALVGNDLEPAWLALGADVAPSIPTVSWPSGMGKRLHSAGPLSINDHCSSPKPAPGVLRR
jgi:hypothetical protein